jgi:hypothetical protein
MKCDTDAPKSFKVLYTMVPMVARTEIWDQFYKTFNVHNFQFNMKLERLSLAAFLPWSNKHSSLV